jgi:hypothetical protein
MDTLKQNNTEFTPPKQNNTFVYLLFIFLGICLITISSVYVYNYYTIIKAIGIVSKVTCVPNTSNKSLYKCELTIQYDTHETVITVENNVKYDVNDTITIYYPEKYPKNVTLIDMDYKILGIGGIIIGTFMFLGSVIAISI